MADLDAANSDDSRFFWSQVSVFDFWFLQLRYVDAACIRVSSSFCMGVQVVVLGAGISVYLRMYLSIPLFFHDPGGSSKLYVREHSSIGLQSRGTYLR
ncbi:uncharacterized protein B0T15DRAFT_540501 [Chaetomium strumarium]|uniref:Uncharacterized protein n=1 Tax=Chaetomium strumarium TaxID=1170767 RepID=A0AAJ0GPK0_9PEZI|nr:hypothetical protein B0T15DRAFT_540501 [Chaetomium strumarium]